MTRAPAAGDPRQEGGAGQPREGGAPASGVERLVPFVPYMLIAAVHVALLFAMSPLAAPTKLLLMPLLAIAVVWASVRVRPWPRAALLALLLGIALSWLGDGSGVFFPMFDDEVPMMLLSFGLAHVAYVLLMWRGRGLAGRGFPAWTLGYALAYVVLMLLLVPHAGALAVPVLGYGALLVATAVFAARCGATVAWGGFWFLVSDAILAFRIFLPEAMPDWTSGAVMFTYTLGQGLIAFGIVARLQHRAAEDAAGSER